MSQKNDSISLRDGAKRTGILVGLLVAVGVITPFISAIGLATHPATQRLFGGRLAEASQFGYSLFWWLVAAVLFALPFLVAAAIEKLDRKGISIVSSILAVVVIAAFVLATLFVF